MGAKIESYYVPKYIDDALGRNNKSLLLYHIKRMLYASYSQYKNNSMYHWHNKTQPDGTVERHWITWNTDAEISEKYPCMKKHQVRSARESLEKDGYIVFFVAQKFGKDALHYYLTDKGMELLKCNQYGVDDEELLNSGNEELLNNSGNEELLNSYNTNEVTNNITNNLSKREKKPSEEILRKHYNLYEEMYLEETGKSRVTSRETNYRAFKALVDKTIENNLPLDWSGWWKAIKYFLIKFKKDHPINPTFPYLSTLFNKMDDLYADYQEWILKMQKQKEEQERLQEEQRRQEREEQEKVRKEREEVFSLYPTYDPGEYEEANNLLMQAWDYLRDDMSEILEYLKKNHNTFESIKKALESYQERQKYERVFRRFRDYEPSQYDKTMEALTNEAHEGNCTIDNILNHMENVRSRIDEKTPYDYLIKQKENRESARRWIQDALEKLKQEDQPERAGTHSTTEEALQEYKETSNALPLD